MKRWAFFTGIVLSVLSTAFLLLTNLPAPRRQVVLSLVSQEYLPQRTIKLRIDEAEYLPLGKDVPLRTDLSVEGSEQLAEAQDVIVSARLDAPEMGASVGEIFEPLYPAMQASFSWTVNAQAPGIYRGVLWIYLQRRGEKGKDHEVLLAHPLELSGRSIAGIPSGTALWIGIAGLGFGLGLVLWSRSAPFTPGFL